MSVVSRVASREMPMFQALAFLAGFLGFLWVVAKHFGWVGMPSPAATAGA